jgi:hypothetical protein
MMDLRSHLQDIAGPAPATAEQQIEADVLRGRTALRRRRAGRAAGGSALAVLVAAAVATTYGGLHDTPPGPTGQDRPATAAAAHLVAYQGTQPKGFTIDRVPDGWYIMSDDNYSLLIAPRWAASAPAGVNPSEAPIYDQQTTTGKIAISLESKSNPGPREPGVTIRFGDRTGALVKDLPPVIPGRTLPADGDYGRRLWVKQSNGTWLTMSFPPGSTLSQDQMADLAAGVHVHRDALIAAG